MLINELIEKIGVCSTTFWAICNESEDWYKQRIIDYSLRGYMSDSLVVKHRRIANNKTCNIPFHAYEVENVDDFITAFKQFRIFRKEYKKSRKKKKITSWTPSMLACYERGCVCDGCPIQENLSFKCRGKDTVLLLVKLHGKPSEIDLQQVVEEK